MQVVGYYFALEPQVPNSILPRRVQAHGPHNQVTSKRSRQETAIMPNSHGRLNAIKQVSQAWHGHRSAAPNGSRLTVIAYQRESGAARRRAPVPG